MDVRIGTAFAGEMKSRCLTRTTLAVSAKQRALLIPTAIATLPSSSARSPNSDDLRVKIFLRWRAIVHTTVLLGVATLSWWWSGSVDTELSKVGDRCILRSRSTGLDHHPLPRVRDLANLHHHYSYSQIAFAQASAQAKFCRTSAAVKASE